MTEKIADIEGFEHRPMVYCSPCKTMVELTFCLLGGPMQKNGHCEYFKEIKKDGAGKPLFLVHAVPVEEKVIETITEERD